DRRSQRHRQEERHDGVRELAREVVRERDPGERAHVLGERAPRGGHAAPASRRVDRHGGERSARQSAAARAGYLRVVRRRSYLLLGAVAVLVAAGVAAGLAVAVFGGEDRTPTPAEYVAQVEAVCQAYGKKLDKIPPPIDIASYGNEIASMK